MPPRTPTSPASAAGASRPNGNAKVAAPAPAASAARAERPNGNGNVAAAPALPAVSPNGKGTTVTPVREHVTPTYYLAGRRFLTRQDPRLAAIIKRAGPCRMRAYQAGEPFSALVETIVSQQLSTRVADVIFGRVAALCGADGVAPARILALDPTALRAAGLSHAKARYVRELAEHVAGGTLMLDDLAALPDEEVTRVLSQVKGIGPWSTHMFLIFRLHRPDVWPIGDLGIVRALERFHGLRTTPSLKRLERLGETWRPYRSLAAWYLWASLSMKDQ